MPRARTKIITIALLLLAAALPLTWASVRALAQKGKSPTAQKVKPAPSPKAKAPARASQPAPKREEFEGDANERRDWFMYQRTFPSGQLPADGRRKAWESRPANYASRSKQALVWTALGPLSTNPIVSVWGTTSGRINAIAVSPSNTNLILLGSATGGIWRSTNGGTNFTPVSDSQVDLGVGAIAFAPSNNNIVYAGMGDSKNNYVGTGVLKSTDAGATWTRVSNNTLPARNLIVGLVVSPTDPNQVYVADRFNGVYVSVDGGVNWTRTLEGFVRDLAHHPTSPTTVYAAMTSAVQNNATQPGGIYRSTDSGGTWTRVYTAPFTNVTDIKVGVTAANPQVVYTYLGGSSGGPRVLRLEVSSNGGDTFTSLGAPAVDPGQFGYNTYLAVSPANINTIFIGSRDVWRSTDGGTTFTNLNGNFSVNDNYTPDQSNAHPDQHSFAFLPGNANTFFIGGDGGIYKTTNNGANFTHLNSTLSLTQFIGLSIDPTDGNRTYGGTQDNGTQRRVTGTNPSQWQEFSGGDGGRSVVNPLNPSTVFSTYIYGSVTRHTNFGDPGGDQVATNATFGEPANGARIAFYPPFTGNFVNQNLYFGTWRLFISTDLGNNWNAPGGMTDLTMGGDDTLSAIGVSRSNLNVIYTGSRDGAAMRSGDGGATWTNVTTGLPQRSITTVTVHPTNPELAYVTVSGYGTGHVFKTTNNGANWTDVSGNLPDIPTQAFLIDPTNPNTIYAGTDIGVFRSETGGTTWTTFNSGLPPVIITQFAAQAGGRIQIGTYGRGAYELTNIQCSYALAPTSQTVPGAGGNGTVNVTTQSGCPWTATSNDGWLTVTGGSPGNGNGSFTFTAAANAGAARNGTITVEGQTFTVMQAAAGCNLITVEPAGSTLPSGTVGTALTRNFTQTGGAGTINWTVSAGTLPNGLTLDAGTGVLSGTPTAAGASTFTIRATDANNCTGERQYSLTINAPGNGLQFFPLPQPVRLLETRAGFGGCTTPGAIINAGGTFTLPARTTCAGIPASAQAVTGNITVVPTGGGFLTLFPSSAQQPTVANSNFGPGEVTNNVFTVGLGAADGAFKIFASGTTHVIVDVTGYYAPPAAGGLYFHPLATPVRLLETRAGLNGCIAPGAQLIGTGDPNADPNLDLAVQGRSPVAAPCNSIPASAQVLVGNATSVVPSNGGFLTIYPSGGTRPLIASSNYAGNDVINGPFAVKLGADGKFKIYTLRTTHLVIDILGYYSQEAVDTNGVGLLFNPLPVPVRLLETRPDFPNFPLPGCTRTNAPIQGNLSAATHTQQAGNFCGLPASAQAVVGNVSVVSTPSGGFLTLFPGNLTNAPLVATSNYPSPAAAGYNRHYFVGLSPIDGTFKILTQVTTDVILDASGYFAP
ncbi:MAG TPA: putative Ig domain-containing protein [Blastocatellia bacterium]|nr:putative Ig domain-containing protein [Blastocatellia bacterium]HNG31918.1 putative Ig domain-containing protein [Blastocatellia bacterium]